ncbi:MAG: helix-turn-helix domain-containing protein [Lachnospiraceae bacterium]|nr:helix-turn-helix domain-containing protein [Lachnospiraceae bacterium]
MMFAKDRADVLLGVTKQLFVDGISAIVIIQAYFKSLPEEVLEFADSINLPIILVSSEKTYAENVVIGLTRAMESSNNINQIEEKISFILQHKVSPATRLMTAQEIIPLFRAPYRFYYLASKHQTNTYSFQHHFQLLKSKSTDGMEILPYQYGILICTMGLDEQATSERLSKLGLHMDEYVTGVSTGCFETDKVANEIREALYAQRYAAKNEKDICRFSDMGIWQMLLPNRDNVWMKNYCDGIIQKLKAADAETGTEVFETVSRYVANGCDTKKTAEEMSVHVNTARYRIKKAQEALELEEKDMEFQQAIWFAFNYKTGIENYFDTF